MADPFVAQQSQFDAAFADAPPLNYDTVLSPAQEAKFTAWKMKNAPRDSGADYDLRGAFKAKITPDAATGHWPDTYKKPNHPTFSVESQYAKYAPHKAGSWGGPNKDQYIPAPPIDLGTGLPATAPPAGSHVVDKYAVTPPPGPDMSNVNFGKKGTRNEAIYPTK